MTVTGRMAHRHRQQRRLTMFERVDSFGAHLRTAATLADACQRNRDRHHHWKYVKLAILNRRAKAAR